MRRSRRRGTSIGTIILALVLIVAYILVRGVRPGGGPAGSPAPTYAMPTSSSAAVATGAEPQWGHQTKTSGCQINGSLPDPACTPGDIIPDATKEKICQSGYASSVRAVTDSTKNKVYAEYGIQSHSPGEYEVDHFVSLELGGSNDISNLFPQAAKPTPGFHEKDKVENYLHDQVCSGAMSLKDAQIAIATNWLAVYAEMQKK